MCFDDDLIREQIAYYRARAGEYDEWWTRTGRYDRGPAQRARWSNEIAVVERALSAQAPLGTVLELACGTGIWTERLAPIADRVRAIDVSPEVIVLNRARVNAANVDYQLADVFDQPDIEAADFIFFAFWLSHVPRSRFESFWRFVRRSLRPRGRVFFIDSLPEQTSTAVDHALDDTGRVRRRLNDGREFNIVKLFYEPADLASMLAALGWRPDVRSTGTYFIYGTVEPS
jgi:SAM-dependent methyltransferase